MGANDDGGDMESPADLLAEPVEDVDWVRSRGKGIVEVDVLLDEGARRLLVDGVRRGADTLPLRRDSHSRPSSSLTGVRGIAMLESEAVEGVAKPASSRSISCSWIWPRASDARLPDVENSDEVLDRRGFDP